MHLYGHVVIFTDKIDDLAFGQEALKLSGYDLGIIRFFGRDEIDFTHGLRLYLSGMKIQNGIYLSYRQVDTDRGQGSVLYGFISQSARISEGFIDMLGAEFTMLLRYVFVVSIFNFNGIFRLFDCAKAVSDANATCMDNMMTAINKKFLATHPSLSVKVYHRI